MLVRGGVSGRQRVVRHLWRMCFGLFIATGSFFIGQPQVFPAFIRRTNLLFIPGIPATGAHDFLANPRSLQKCIQEKVGARQ